MMVWIRAALSILAFLGAAIGMEFVARFMHKYVMHGAGWCLHYDHHNHKKRLFQKNDLYALFFAVTSFGLIYGGLRLGVPEMAAAGFGVALYGVGYVVFHDIMYHGRIPGLRFKPKSNYMKRIINAHRVHHATVTQGGAVSFSFLWASKFYDPRNQEAVKQKMAEIHSMQLAIKRRERSEAVRNAVTQAGDSPPPNQPACSDAKHG